MTRVETKTHRFGTQGVIRMGLRRRRDVVTVQDEWTARGVPRRGLGTEPAPR